VAVARALLGAAHPLPREIASVHWSVSNPKAAGEQRSELAIHSSACALRADFRPPHPCFPMHLCHFLQRSLVALRARRRDAELSRNGINTFAGHEHLTGSHPSRNAGQLNIWCTHIGGRLDPNLILPWTTPPTLSVAKCLDPSGRRHPHRLRTVKTNATGGLSFHSLAAARTSTMAPVTTRLLASQRVRRMSAGSRPSRILASR